MESIDIEAVVAEVTALNLSAFSLPHLRGVEHRLALAIHDVETGVRDSHSVEDLRELFELVRDRREKLELGESDLPRRMQAMEERIAELEEGHEGFRSVRKWATGIFGVALVFWVLIASEGLSGLQQALIVALALALGLLWRYIWRY